MRKNDRRRPREESEQRFSRGGGRGGGGGKGHLFYRAFVFSVFISLFSLLEENKSFFGFLARKKRETKKVKKVLVFCVFSLFARNFFSSDEKRANEKKQTRKKLLKIVQTTQRVTEKTYIISLLVLFLKTHRKRRSGLISRARLFWTLPSGEEERRVERKERRDFGERESASRRKFE